MRAYVVRLFRASSAQQKVENLRSKLSTVDRFDEMLEATHKLRLQQDEQVKLQDRLKEQKSQLLHAEHRLHGLNQRMDDERRNESAASTNPKALLDKLDREVTGAHPERPSDPATRQPRHTATPPHGDPATWRPAATRARIASGRERPTAC